MKVRNKGVYRRKWLKTTGLSEFVVVKVLNTDGWQSLSTKETRVGEGGRMVQNSQCNIIYLIDMMQSVEVGRNEFTF